VILISAAAIVLWALRPVSLLTSEPPSTSLTVPAPAITAALSEGDPDSAAAESTEKPATVRQLVDAPLEEHTFWNNEGLASTALLALRVELSSSYGESRS